RTLRWSPGVLRVSGGPPPSTRDPVQLRCRLRGCREEWRGRLRLRRDPGSWDRERTGACRWWHVPGRTYEELPATAAVAPVRDGCASEPVGDRRSGVLNGCCRPVPTHERRACRACRGRPAHSALPALQAPCPHPACPSGARRATLTSASCPRCS